MDNKRRVNEPMVALCSSSITTDDPGRHQGAHILRLIDPIQLQMCRTINDHICRKSRNWVIVILSQKEVT